MRAALYHRVSTLDQNPEAAFHELEIAAKQRGAKVVVAMKEKGSGANNDRPGLQQILRDARRGYFDQVLVWKLDRFGRSALDLLANIRTLTNAGVGFAVITQGIELRPGGDAMTNLLITMLAAVAEFERELIGERTRAGMAHARRNGKHVGRPRVERVDPRDVAELRGNMLAWGEIAATLGCSVHAAQHAHATLAKRGASKT